MNVTYEELTADEHLDYIEAFCDDCGFTFAVCDERGGKVCAELENYPTPAGEDWIATLWFEPDWESFGKALYDYARDFDPDEEAAKWVSVRGTRGIPDSIRTLIDDADWKNDEVVRFYNEWSATPRPTEEV